MPVPSPCTKVCQLDPQARVCVGCWRSTDEIARWMSMSDAERLATLARCAARTPRTR